jgi:hypothetical protein
MAFIGIRVRRENTAMDRLIANMQVFYLKYLMICESCWSSRIASGGNSMNITDQE